MENMECKYSRQKAVGTTGLATNVAEMLNERVVRDEA